MSAGLNANLELEVRARHWYVEGARTTRDVYLRKRDGGALSPFLMHTQCPLARWREIVEWAHDNGIPVFDEPEGSIDPDFKFPEPPSPPSAPVPLPEPSF